MPNVVDEWKKFLKLGDQMPTTAELLLGISGTVIGLAGVAGHIMSSEAKQETLRLISDLIAGLGAGMDISALILTFITPTQTS
jgi:hypothetical protein